MERAPDDERGGPARDNGTSAGAGDAPRAGGVASPAGAIYSWRLKLLVVGVVAASVALISALVLRTDDSGSPGQGSDRDGVLAVYPTEGSQALRQATVRVDLRPGWNGRLTVGGEVIPEAQLRRSGEERLDTDQTAGIQDRLEFVPGPDKVFDALPEGRLCARAEVWRRATGPEGGSQAVDWCFQVV